MTPEQRAAKNARQREWRRKNPERCRAYKRKECLREGGG